MIKPPMNAQYHSLLQFPSKIVHTNLQKVSNNRVNHPHNHYEGSYYTQIMTIVRKTKCYRLT